MKIEHIQAHTFHGRRGAIRNSFRYGVDLVLMSFEASDTPALLSRNHFNLWSVWDRRHGGERDNGSGEHWFRTELNMRGGPEDAQIVLLTQPSFLWFHFNPVSFWIALRDGKPLAFLAEVNNTFGDRHCYFCAHQDFRPIKAQDVLAAEKLMHVSPYQEVEGRYHFNFGWDDDAINIRIDYRNGDNGVLATLDGKRRVASNRSLAWAALRRPFGAARVVALIHWQALKLWIKRAPFFSRPSPKEGLVSEAQVIGEHR